VNQLGEVGYYSRVSTEAHMELERDGIELCADCMIAAVNGDFPVVAGEVAEGTAGLQLLVRWAGG